MVKGREQGRRENKGALKGEKGEFRVRGEGGGGTVVLTVFLQYCSISTRLCNIKTASTFDLPAAPGAEGRGRGLFVPLASSGRLTAIMATGMTASC